MSGSTSASTPGYTVGQGAPITSHFSQRSASRDGAFVLQYVQPSSRILDIGCGPGSITCDFASLVAAGGGHVTGVDVSSVAISNARATASKRGLSNIEFHVADISGQLPFENETFDLVFCHQLLSHLSDPTAALREMKKLAKRGGYVAVRETIETNWYPATSKLERYVYWVREVFRRGGSKDANVARHLPEYAHEAGFNEASKVAGSVSGQAYTSEEEKMHIVEGTKILLAEDGSLRSRAIDAGATTRELEDILAEVDAWERNPDAWMAWLALEMIWQM